MKFYQYGAGKLSIGFSRRKVSYHFHDTKPTSCSLPVYQCEKHRLVHSLFINVKNIVLFTPCLSM